MRVLIAEDDPTSRSLLGRVLSKWGYEVLATADGEEAWREFQRAEAPPLAVLDWMMPGLDGVEVCRRVRELDSPSPPYIILLTARGGKGDIVAGLDAGANDYLGKPFDHDEFRARLEVGRRFVEVNQKLMETQHALEVQARTDPLTGCMNRRAILERLEQEMTRAERQGTSLGLGMIDIDHFKCVNDTYGHTAGDEVLRQFVSRSVLALGSYDALGRFGGDEFLVVVPEAGGTQTRAVLERIRQAVCGSPIEAERNGVRVTVSVGGATSGRESVDALIRAADAALYEAKSGGRNRVVMAQVPVAVSGCSSEAIVATGE